MQLCWINKDGCVSERCTFVGNASDGVAEAEIDTGVAIRIVIRLKDEAFFVCVF